MYSNRDGLGRVSVNTLDPRAGDLADDVANQLYLEDLLDRATSGDTARVGPALARLSPSAVWRAFAGALSLAQRKSA